ncbi:MAG: hypothetical protein K6G30_08535, partial [Acetatifactor sp.]|nr:hypothetical protein [Acetatifactor sp.]
MIEIINNIYCISTNKSSYVIRVGKTPVNLYFGPRLHAADFCKLDDTRFHSSFDTSIENERAEYYFWDSYMEIEPNLKFSYDDNRKADMEFLEGTKKKQGDVELLTLKFKNSYTDLYCELQYKVYEELDIIAKRAVIRNE